MRTGWQENRCWQELPSGSSLGIFVLLCEVHECKVLVRRLLWVKVVEARHLRSPDRMARSKPPRYKACSAV